MSYLFFVNDVLFFAMEKEDQVDYIMKGIREFSAASGQWINHNKFSIFFSSNLSYQITESLAQE